MKVKITAGRYQPRVTLQKAGYYEFQDPRTGDLSYVRRLGTGFYPRFHLYLKVEGGNWLLNLHLDQKQASYAGYTKHSGEYDGDLVEEEMQRILGVID